MIVAPGDALLSASCRVPNPAATDGISGGIGGDDGGGSDGGAGGGACGGVGGDCGGVGGAMLQCTSTSSMAASPAQLSPRTYWNSNEAE